MLKPTISEVDLTFHLVVISLNICWFQFCGSPFVFWSKSLLHSIFFSSLDLNYFQNLPGSCRMGAGTTGLWWGKGSWFWLDPLWRNMSLENLANDVLDFEMLAPPSYWFEIHTIEESGIDVKRVEEWIHPQHFLDELTFLLLQNVFLPLW